MKHTWIMVLAAALAPWAVAMAADATEADAKLQACFRQYLEGLFQQRPLEATRLGDHRFDGSWTTFRPTARAGWVAHTRQTLEELPRQVDCAGLSRRRPRSISRSSGTICASSLWLAENTRPFEEDPRVYNELRQRQRLPAADAIDAAQGNEHRQRHRPDGADSASSLAAARQNLHNPPAGSGRDGHRPEPRRDRASTSTTSSTWPAPTPQRGGPAGRRRSGRQPA